MSFSHLNKVEKAGAKLGIVAPDGREGMMQHARDFAEAGVPFISIRARACRCSAATSCSISCAWPITPVSTITRPGCCATAPDAAWQLAGDVRALIVTRGGEGSEIYADGRRYDIPCVEAEEIIDPTGCGDAYRSGLLYGIANGYDWEKTGRLAAVMGRSRSPAGRPESPAQPRRDRRALPGAFGTLPW